MTNATPLSANKKTLLALSQAFATVARRLPQESFASMIAEEIAADCVHSAFQQYA